MKRVIALALVLAVLGWAGPARAVIGTVDQVPGATLLLPHFEVDLDDASGVTTLLSINNASATAALAHVVFWTDLSVPTFTFNVYLTGYDVQTINLRDIFVNGVLPQTATVGQDPGDTISPQGIISQDINYTNCTGQLPPPSFAQVLAAHGGDPNFDFKTHLQQAHTGGASVILGNQCAGGRWNDRVARGYITVDVVNGNIPSNCPLTFPGDAGYFVTGGLGAMANQNILWGDYFYVNPGQNFAQGETLVHIEAAPGTGTTPGSGSYGPDPETTVPGEYTFYGRYVNWTAADNREPLATSFATRYVTGGAFTGGTDLIVWRDSKVAQGPFACGTVPAWYPLGQEAVVVFDEQENPQIIPSAPFGPQPTATTRVPFALESVRRPVGSAQLPVPFDFGWLYLNLNVSVAAAGANPPEDPLAAQAWVTTVHDAEGRFSVGYHATQLDSATKALHFVPGP